MKRPSIPVCIIIIVYLVVLFFMLIDLPFAPMPGGMMPGSTKGYIQETLYGALFREILALTVVAVLALFVSSLVSHRRKGKEGEEW